MAQPIISNLSCCLIETNQCGVVPGVVCAAAAAASGSTADSTGGSTAGGMGGSTAGYTLTWVALLLILPNKLHNNGVND
jgi:hypothetical protein